MGATLRINALLRRIGATYLIVALLRIVENPSRNAAMRYVAPMDTAAEVRRALEKAGEEIGMADSLIAGTVLRHGGALLTRNLRHFSRVDGLGLAKLD